MEFGDLGKPHPLLIPTIAHKILSHLSYNDLKQLRCVCFQWNYEASHLLQRKTQIRFSTEVQILKYMKNFPEGNSSCSSFEMGHEIFIKSFPVQEYFDRYGKDIKSLKLHSADWSSWQLWDLLSQRLTSLEEISIRIFIPKYGHLFPDPGLSPSLPNIKRLNLSFCIDHTDVYFTNPTILKELFLAVPNLEVLSCPNWPTIILPSTTVSTLVFNVILSEPLIKFGNLSYLNINANLSNADIKELLGKGFPLKELRLEISPSVRGFYLVCLLISLESTLESLCLTFPNYYEVCQFESLPRMKNLTSLSLHKFQGSLYSVVENFRGLQTLLLNEVFLSGVNYFGRHEAELFRPVEGEINNPEENQCQSGAENPHMLEELNILVDTPIGHITELIKLFPNIKRLTMQNVNDVVLRIIFSKMTCLEEFVGQGNFTDSGLTGFPLEICQRMIEDEIVITTEDAAQLRLYNYVGDLKQLRKINLDSNMVTYLSVLYGVSDCKELVDQKICKIVI